MKIISDWFARFNAWFDQRNWFLQLAMMLGFVFFIRTFFFGLYVVPTGSMEPTMLVGESFFAIKIPFLLKNIKRGEIVSINDPTFNYSNNFFKRTFQHYVWGPDNWTKRVVGLPGERVQGKIIDGKPAVFINGIELNEPYVNPYPLVDIREKSVQMQLNWPLFVTAENNRPRTFDPTLAFDDPKQPFYHISPSDVLPSPLNPHIYYPYAPDYSGNNSRNYDVFDVTLGDDEYWLMGDNRRGSSDSRYFGKIKRNIIHGKILFRIMSIDSPNSLLYDIFTHPIDFFTKKLRPWKRWFNFRFNKDYIESMNTQGVLAIK